MLLATYNPHMNTIVSIIVYGDDVPKKPLLHNKSCSLISRLTRTTLDPVAFNLFI